MRRKHVGEHPAQTGFLCAGAAYLRRAPHLARQRERQLLLDEIEIQRRLLVLLTAEVSYRARHVGEALSFARPAVVHLPQGEHRAKLEGLPQSDKARRRQ